MMPALIGIIVVMTEMTSQQVFRHVHRVVLVVVEDTDLKEIFVLAMDSVYLSMNFCRSLSTELAE
jgi:hypothetical protein